MRAIAGSVVFNEKSSFLTTRCQAEWGTGLPAERSHQPAGRRMYGFQNSVWPFAEEECKRSTISLKKAGLVYDTYFFRGTGSVSNGFCINAACLLTTEARLFSSAGHSTPVNFSDTSHSIRATASSIAGGATYAGATDPFNS